MTRVLRLHPSNLAALPADVARPRYDLALRERGVPGTLATLA